MAKYVELLLLRGENEDCILGAVPTSTAHSGDIAMVDGEMFDVECTGWIDTEGDLFKVISEGCKLHTVDMILHERYNKEDLHVEI